MFGTKFITFKPTTGVYLDTIKPYKKWYEKTDMSPLIEIEGQAYRIIRTTGRLNTFYPRKMLVCREDGQMETSEEITRMCFTKYFYVAYLQANLKNISFDASQGGKKRHESLIRNFKTIISDLESSLNDTKVQAMTFHLHYLEEVWRWINLMAEEAKVLLDLKRQLVNLKSDNLSEPLIKELANRLGQRLQFKNNLIAILIEDNQRARVVVKEVLQNSIYIRKMSDKAYYDYIIHDLDEAHRAAERFLREEKQARKEAGDLSSFSVDQYIYRLRYEMDLEQKKEKEMENLMTLNWVLSPDCFFM
ncbi:MAG TPA: hypothetical protein VK119_09660 [Bacillota bacterium]|nr:hypothetical protein [Bacillota bacterium]